MPRIRRVFRSTALALSLAALALAACKDTGAAARAPAGDGAPVVTAEPEAPPVQTAGITTSCSPDDRAQTCSRVDLPVCGTMADETRKSYADPCEACEGPLRRRAEGLSARRVAFAGAVGCAKPRRRGA